MARYTAHQALVEGGLLNVRLVALRCEIATLPDQIACEMQLRALYARDLTDESLPYLATSQPNLANPPPTIATAAVAPVVAAHRPGQDGDTTTATAAATVTASAVTGAGAGHRGALADVDGGDRGEGGSGGSRGRSGAVTTSHACATEPPLHSPADASNMRSPAADNPRGSGSESLVRIDYVKTLGTDEPSQVRVHRPSHDARQPPQPRRLRPSPLPLAALSVTPGARAAP